MPFAAASEDIDFDLLAAYLKALAHPGRLELLWRLRFPANPAEVEVRPRRKDQLAPERAMSRQTVLEHLAKLEEAGVVTRVANPEGGADRWVTNVPQVFSLVEEIRKLTAIPSAPSLDAEETMARADDHSSPWLPGPKLVLMSGPWEGRLFALQGSGPWHIGRSRSKAVALSYDPFISAEHAVLEKHGGKYSLGVLPETRNPTRVNFAPVLQGKPRDLAQGDIIGVGRSLLVFHER
ncbi:MAG: FHA domain-containing protein [Halobacteriales archaeon]|nr:FHA domain-containing protein [Halobacteriales archaeon]